MGAEWNLAHRQLDAAGLSADAEQALQESAISLHFRGEVRAAISICMQAIAYADQKGLVQDQHAARAVLALMQLMGGELEEFDQNAAALKGGANYTAHMAWSWRLAIATRFDEAIDALPPLEMAVGVPVYRAHIHAVRTRVLWTAGRRSAAQEEFEQWREAVDAVGPLDRLGGFCTSLLCESFVPALGDREFIQDVYVQLCTAPYDDYSSSIGDRGAHALRGDLALHLDRVEEAESHYRREFEVAGRERLPVSLGVAHQGLAEVAERRGDIETAREHLDLAGEIFAQHDAKLYLNQVIAKKEILKA